VKSWKDEESRLHVLKRRLKVVADCFYLVQDHQSPRAYVYSSQASSAKDDFTRTLPFIPPFHAMLTVLFAMIYYLSRCDEGKMGNRNGRSAASIEKETLSRLPEEVHHIIMLPIFI